MPKSSKKRLSALIHASQIYTGAGVRARDGRHVQDQDMGAIPDGAIVFGDQIEWVGPTDKMPAKYRKIAARDLKIKSTVTPGWVDCHTHPVFAGDRAEEFALRCGGMSYEQIAARGGGILTTVRATREASPSNLERLARARIKEMAAFGVCTLEIKSGYGLSVESEIKSLEIAQGLKKHFPHLTLKVTFLGAHAFPPAGECSREDYIALICEKMLPIIAKRKLADACDVFVDQGYYTLDEARKILAQASKLGLQTKVHADELANTESAAFAASVQALSADHLLKISTTGIEKIAASQTVAVLLPGTAFYLKAPYAPARKLIDAGACVALATDFNPGSCMCPSLPTIMTLAALYMGMTRAEIFSAVTYAGAKALGLHGKKGSLEVGKDADFTLLPCERFEEVYYRFSGLPVALDVPRALGAR